MDTRLTLNFHDNGIGSFGIIEFCVDLEENLVKSPVQLRSDADAASGVERFERVISSVSYVTAPLDAT